MIDAISHLNVWVDDQDEAKSFYTEKLGFEVRQDNTRRVRRLPLAHRRTC
jgi:catechol 2,3-dioxygenase-like lactoylglutathione lyase family enzyme